MTARKRSENLQSVPLSIVAVSGDALVKAGATKLADLPGMAPGLSISSVGSFVSYTYIRGGGTNNIDPGSDPSVAYFVDEVYIGGNEGLQFDLYDIDHVEVLKGPQGTLFGRNAASGAISIVTKRPTTDFEGSADLEYGNYNSLVTRASVSGPLDSTGSLLGRLSATYHRRDGVTENLAGGGDPGNINAGGTRGQLEWRGQDVDVLLTGSLYKARNGQTNLFITTQNVAGYVDPTLPEPGGQSTYAHYYNFIGFENQDLFDTDVRIQWTTPLGEVTSISAFRSNRYSRDQDNDGTIYEASRQDSKENTNSFSQEIRLAGDLSSWIHETVGSYFYHSDTDFSYASPKGPANPVASQRGLLVSDASRYLVDSYAAFAQATLDITKQWNVELGGRYTQDDKQDRRTVDRFGAIYSVDPSAAFHGFTPAVTLNYTPQEGILTYLSYRQGYKSGGFQSLAPLNATVANTPFLPEHVNSYEFGVKASSFDERVQASAALFRSDIRDQQISTFDGRFTTVVINNAGRTRAQGVDLALAARPIPALTLTANATFQHARFVDFQNGAINYDGNRQLRSPDLTAYFAADYSVSLGGFGGLRLHGDYSRTSTQFFDNANTELPGLYQPSYGIGNLRATLAPQNLPVEFSVFVRNVGNTLYFQNIAIVGVTGAGVPNDPRTYAVAISAHF